MKPCEGKPVRHENILDFRFNIFDLMIRFTFKLGIVIHENILDFRFNILDSGIWFSDELGIFDIPSFFMQILRI
jgi:hypothetical protein